MCLWTKLSDEKLTQAKAKLPKRLVVWKVCTKWFNGRYGPAYTNMQERFYAGWQHAATSVVVRDLSGDHYWSGFHAFLTRRDARAFRQPGSRDVVLHCEAYRKDITAIGTQDRARCIVLGRVKFPPQCGRRPRKKTGEKS